MNKKSVLVRAVPVGGETSKQFIVSIDLSDKSKVSVEFPDDYPFQGGRLTSIVFDSETALDLGNAIWHAAVEQGAAGENLVATRMDERIKQEKERFEKWAAPRGFDITKDREGDYISPITVDVFWGWLAALELKDR